MRLLIELSLVVALTAPVPAGREQVPAEFVYDQVWVTPSLHGEKLRFFTDTGGGWNAIAANAAERVGMTADSGARLDSVPWPKFDEGDAMPKAPAHFLGGGLAVVPSDQLLGGDGFLGGRWFADGVWKFDYPGKKLYRLDAFHSDDDQFHRAELGFQINAAGVRTMHFPSIDVVIQGEVLPMLYDSGATATTTEASGAVFDVLPGTGVGTSFVERSVFQRWVTKNPDWRVIEAADQKGVQQRRMIEVPAITVAGYTVGPVWFAEQPDGAFQTYMAGMMDRPTWGALGGSALKYCVVILNYPESAAYFRCDETREVSTAATQPHSTPMALTDAKRGRELQVEIYFPVAGSACVSQDSCPVVFVSPGYGIPHTSYSFLGNALAQQGRLVIAVQHDLPSDPPLGGQGDLVKVRTPAWQRGSANLRFVKSELSRTLPGYDWSNLTLIGHSNGGDISSLLLRDTPGFAARLVTLDSRRVPLPRDSSLPVLSIRASDFEADPGVLPSETEKDATRVCVVEIPHSRHNDMFDGGTPQLKSEINALIRKFMLSESCGA